MGLPGICAGLKCLNGFQCWAGSGSGRKRKDGVWQPGPKGLVDLVCPQAASCLGQFYIECAQFIQSAGYFQSPGLSDQSKPRGAGCVKHTPCLQPTLLCPVLDMSLPPCCLWLVKFSVWLSPRLGEGDQSANPIRTLCFLVSFGLVSSEELAGGANMG